MVMIELENLKEEFLNKFLKGGVEKDVIKSVRKVLKEFKEHIYAGDSLQKILQMNNQGHSGGSALSGITSSTIGSGNSSSSSSKQYKNQSSNAVGQGIADLSAEVSAQSNQQRFLLVAACEEIQKLLKYIVQPYIIVKSCITNFETIGKTDDGELGRIIRQEFLSIEKRILHVLKNYQEVLPISIIDSLQQLQTYYVMQKEEYLKMEIHELEKIKTVRYLQLQAPYIGYHLVDEAKVNVLFDKSSTSIDNIKIQRVGTEFVHHFQKYLTTYVFNKLLVDSDILSGLVVCVKDNKKKKTFFFIQYCNFKVEDIESAFSQEQQIIVTLNKYGVKQADQPTPTRNVDMNSFLKQIAASFISMSFESFIPNYGICSETGKLYRHQISTSNEDRTAHAGIKNPLYFFKESFMIEKKSCREFEECLNLKRCNMANFLEALTLLHEFQKTDFKFEFKKGRKLQSLFLPKEHIASLQAIVQEFSKTLVWLEESVFPVNGRVCLLQIINQIQPLVIEFSNRIMSKSMQEHLGFMKKISIEDFLIKISSKKALKKYLFQNKSFEDNRFLKDETNLGSGGDTKGTSNASTSSASQGQQGGSSSSGQPNQTGQQQQQGASGNNQGSQLNANQNSMAASINFSASSSSFAAQSQNSSQQSQISSSGIQITYYLMDLNLLNFHKKERKVILKYAAENMLYLPMVMSLEHVSDSIKKFNKSWRSTQLWSDNYTFTINEGEDETNQLLEANRKLTQKYCGLNDVQISVQQNAQPYLSIPKNDSNNNNNNNNCGYVNSSFATPTKTKQSQPHLQLYHGNDTIISSNENVSSSNQLQYISSERNLENEFQKQKLSKQYSSNQTNFESIFVELLGLVFNMNIMSILTNQTFQSIKYFDEDNSTHIYLIKNYFQFPQIRGDKGFKLCGTLLERSICLKKYRLACLLLDQGEGVNITKDVIFNYLSEVKLQPQKSNHDNNNQQHINNKSQYNEVNSPIHENNTNNQKLDYVTLPLKNCEAREDFDEKIQSLVIKHHAQWLNEFNWEKMWRQEFNPLNYTNKDEYHSDNNNLLAYTYEYGVRSFPIHIWSQIFDFQRVDIDQFNILKNPNSQNINLIPQNKIVEQKSEDEEQITSKNNNGLHTNSNQRSHSNVLQPESRKMSHADQSPKSEGKRSQSGSKENIHDEDDGIKNEDVIQEEKGIEQQKGQQQQKEDQGEGQKHSPKQEEQGQEKSHTQQVDEQTQNEEQNLEIQNEEKQKSRKSSCKSVNSVDKNQVNKVEEVQEDNQNTEGGNQLSPFVEKREQLSGDKREQSSCEKSSEKQQQGDQTQNSPSKVIKTPEDNKNRRELFLNFDEKEEEGEYDELKVNQTLRLTPFVSQVNMIDYLQEGTKLCGTLKMKKFSCLDEKNYFISNYLSLLENSTVQLRQRKLLVVHGKNLDLLIEENADYPGLAYAEDSLVSLFSDHIRPKRMLVRINDVDYTFTQILHNCQSLDIRIKQGLPLHFEKQSLGERIILSMILNKQYNGFEDEVLEVHPTIPREFRLINISSSQPFQTPIIRYNSVNYVINVRNILFCMDQMNESIDPSLMLKYRQINPDKLLDDWLTDLYFSQQRILTQRIVINNPKFLIITTSSSSSASQKNNEENQTSQQSSQLKQAILFQKGMMKQLYNRLLRLTRYLKKIHMDDHSNILPKYQQIFDVVSPLLADMYKRVNTQKEASLTARFESIESNLDKFKSFVTCDIPSFYSNFTLEKIYNYESLEEIISTFKSIGPLSSKEIIKHLAKLSRRDNHTWEDVFQNVNKNTQIKTMMINGQLEPDWSDSSMVERFITQLCLFQQKPVSEFKHLLSNLIFDSCDCTSWKMLRNIGHDRITTLSLRGCTKITDTDVVKISETMPMLTYLDLSKNQNIFKFNHTITSKYQQSKPLQFPQLKTLILEENINMVICDIEGQHIQNINLSTCILLQNLMTATPNLKRICLNMCPSLLEEHAILYIIEGTNCMLDDTTSSGAFKQALSQMSKSTHSKLSTYKTYVLTIFGRLFNKVKIMLDVYPLLFALNRRGLNKTTHNKESSSFFGFTKKPTTTPDSVAKSCRMSILNLLLKNSNIRELKFMSICEEFRDMNISSLLEILCDKFQESANSSNRIELVTDIDTIDLSDIKLKESNMKHLGEIISLIKTTSSQGLSIFLQSTQDPQSKGLQYFCQGALKNDINKIDFTKNKLGAEQIEEICKMIEGVNANNKLSQLFLKNCNINNDLLVRISQAIKKNSTLRLLDLSDNSFDHEGLKPFMQSLYDNTTLTSLMLDGNALSGPGFISIQKGRFLKKLHLEQCWLEEQEIWYLCQLLQENEQLNYLDLSYNKVNIKSTLNLIKSIKNSNCLKELVIKKIFDEDESIQNASRISEILISNTSLQTLDISDNSIGSDGLIQFGRALTQNSALRVLIINDDHTIGLRGVANLAELIQNNQTLQILDIQRIDQNQESRLEGFQAAWEIVKQKLHKNNLIRLSKVSSKKHNISFPYQKKANTSPTHKSLDQSSFYVGGEKLDSTRIKGTSDHYRLGLSIDGGGMRGIIPGCIIQYLCQHTKREVHEIFDIVGGTSIGGILALTLACSLDGKTPIARGVDLVQFFEENGQTIFNSSKIVALWNNLRDKSKYDPAGIESILKKFFQNCKLSDVLKGTNVITTAMKRESIRGKNMSKIFRSKEAMFSDDKNFYVRDIGRATSAAPTYFPSAEIKSVNGSKKYSLIDGALGQNNPSKLVLDDIKTEALNSGNEKNFYLLSLSTGTAITTQQIAQNAGLFNLMPIINSLGEGALAFLDRDIEKSADGQYLRINPEIPIKKHEAELDNTDPKILEIYKQCAYNAAEKYLSQDLKYGPFNDQNLLDWLAENTAKKKDTYI